MNRTPKRSLDQRDVMLPRTLQAQGMDWKREANDTGRKNRALKNLPELVIWWGSKSML